MATAQHQQHQPQGQQQLQQSQPQGMPFGGGNGHGSSQDAAFGSLLSPLTNEPFSPLGGEFGNGRSRFGSIGSLNSNAFPLDLIESNNAHPATWPGSNSGYDNIFDAKHRPSASGNGNGNGTGSGNGSGRYLNVSDLEALLHGNSNGPGLHPQPSQLQHQQQARKPSESYDETLKSLMAVSGASTGGNGGTGMKPLPLSTAQGVPTSSAAPPYGRLSFPSVYGTQPLPQQQQPQQPQQQQQQGARQPQQPPLAKMPKLEQGVAGPQQPHGAAPALPSWRHDEGATSSHSLTSDASSHKEAPPSPPRRMTRSSTRQRAAGARGAGMADTTTSAGSSATSSPAARRQKKKAGGRATKRGTTGRGRKRRQSDASSADGGEWKHKHVEVFESDASGNIRGKALTPEEEQRLRDQLKFEEKKLADMVPKLEQMTPKERKKVRNRQASCVSRLRKKLFIWDLQKNYTEAVHELEEKRQQLAERDAEIQQLRSRLQLLEGAHLPQHMNLYGQQHHQQPSSSSAS